MRKFGLTAAVLAAGALLWSSGANATEILDFAQPSGAANGLLITNPSLGVTDINTGSGGTPVEVSAIVGGVPATPFAATLNFTATNTTSATVLLGQVIQHFMGTFSVASPSCGANPCLTGSFTDVATGTIGGATLVFNVGNPPNTLGFCEAATPASACFIPQSELGNPTGFSFSTSNIPTPGLQTVNIGAAQTIAQTTAFATGTTSATAAITTPEPASLTLLGSALLGLGWLGRRRRKTL